MKLFKLNNQYSITCESKGTRSGFKHEAVLFNNGHEIGRNKICYLNRTWESYEYESVIKKIINVNFKEKEAQRFINKVNPYYKGV